MRNTPRHIAPILVCLLVAACGATTPSVPPPVSPSPSGTAPAVVASPAPPATAKPTASAVLAPEPASPPVASGWPYPVGGDQPVFGPDGSIYFLAPNAEGTFYGRLVALDVAGHVRPGWPIEAPTASDFSSLAVGPDGSVYVQERGGLKVGSVLHRLDTDGRDLPGWPFGIPADFACPAGEPYNTDDPRTAAADDPCYPPTIEIAPNGNAYVTSGKSVSPRLIAIDASGKVLPGWPIELDDHEWSDQRLAADGSVFLVRRPVGTPTHDENRGRVDDDAELWAFGPNGKRRAGWPVPVPNIGGYLISPQGDIVVWSWIDDKGELCSEPRRTLYTVIAPDGRIRAGWPRGSTGFASTPVVGDDGTMYYVSATRKVYAHDRAGEVKAGWPVVVPGASYACGPGAPFLGADGTILVKGDEVVALGPDGHSRPGWPYRPAGALAGPCLDSECYGGHGAPGLGPDGTVYLIEYKTNSAGVRAEVVAIDRRGRLKPGWPYRLPFDANTVSIGVFNVSLDGRLFIGAGYSPSVLLALDPDGTLAD